MSFLSAFSRALLRHLLLAGAALAVALLAVEWLVPGSVGTRVPLVPAAFGFAALAVASASALVPSRTRFLVAPAFLLPFAAAGAALVLFAVRAGSAFVRGTVALAVLLVLLAAVAFFLPDRDH